MTIKIEREAVLTALGASNTTLPSPSSYRSTATLLTHHHDATYSSLKSQEMIQPLSLPSSWSQPFRDHCCMVEQDSIPELDDTDDDCTTVSSCSSDARSRSLSRVTVTFASVLVTEVRTRPRTRPEDVSALFYSCAETQRFRQEYRKERHEVHNDEITTPSEPTPAQTTLPLLNGNCGISNKDETVSTNGHRISRVVVMHEDTLETFVDKDMALLQAPISLGIGDITAASDDFFDNDRFWSGQITWY